MTKVEKAGYELGLKNAAAFVRLFILSSFCKGYERAEKLGDRWKNEDIEQLAKTIENLEPGLSDYLNGVKPKKKVKK